MKKTEIRVHSHVHVHRHRHRHEHGQGDGNGRTGIGTGTGTQHLQRSKQNTSVNKARTCPDIITTPLCLTIAEDRGSSVRIRSICEGFGPSRSATTMPPTRAPPAAANARESIVLDCVGRVLLVNSIGALSVGS